MRNPFRFKAPPFDAGAINSVIRQSFAAAGLNTRTGPMREVAEVIRRALEAGRGVGAGGARASGTDDDDGVIDVTARVVPEVGPDAGPDAKRNAGRDADRAAEPADANAPAHRAAQPPGSFETHTFRNAVGSRAYKVYLPARQPTQPRAMVVMLHGCTQSPDDFAAGTQMNRLADEHGFIVVYPEQTAQANPSKCWNWFKPEDQQRDRGEPALIAGLVREVARRHGADPTRIFVAGLSAGAAMALVLGETHPELFAGVGVHSGLPYGSAHDIPSALAAMKGGRSGLQGMKTLNAAAPRGKAVQAVPTIVFHGDRDQTVRPSNGAHIVQQACDAHGARPDSQGLQAETQTGVSPGGRRYTRVVHADADGRVFIESWTLHGAGHAWSGGHASGSYVDTTGPAASAEMVRFFLALSGSGRASAMVDEDEHGVAA